MAVVRATMASAAEAGEFTAENYGATVTGTQLTKHEFQFNGGAIDCTVASFGGKLTGPAEALTVAAEYGNCSTAGGAGVTVIGTPGSKVETAASVSGGALVATPLLLTAWVSSRCRGRSFDLDRCRMVEPQHPPVIEGGIDFH